jgi:exopolysaccharide production protein ExoZ
MQPKPYYYGIDLLRFLAALMVACFHLGWSNANPGSRGFDLSKGELTLPFGHLFVWGSVGVEIFFVISGFVIANSANGSTPFGFLRSRAERLYPAVWICAPLSLIVWLMSGSGDLADHLTNFAQTVALFPFGWWVDSPYWSLGHEIIFYGLIFLVLLTGQIPRLEQVAMGVTGLSGAFWGAVIYGLTFDVEVPGLAFFTEHAGKMLLTYYGAFFALGIFIWLSRAGRLGLAGKVAALAATALCLIQISGLAEGEASPVTAAKALIWLFGVGALVTAARFEGARDDNGLGWLRSLGLATYPLYLVHFAVGLWIMRRLVEHGASVTLAFISTLAGLIVLAFCVANYGEPLIRRAIRGGFNAADRLLAHWRSLFELLHRQGGVAAPLGE